MRGVQFRGQTKMVVVILVAGQYVIPSFSNTSAIRGVYGEISAIVEGDDG